MVDSMLSQVDQHSTIDPELLLHFSDSFCLALGYQAAGAAGAAVGALPKAEKEEPTENNSI